MSALGHKRTFCAAEAMSALPPKADMCDAKTNVRFVPIADILLFKRSTLRPQECAGFWSSFRWTPNQRPVQLGDRLRELIVMQDIVLRYTTNRRSQFSQDVGEQAKVDMHVN